MITISSSMQSTIFSEHSTVLAAEDSRETGPVLVSELPTQFPIVSAQGVMVFDINSGRSLFEKNADETLLPASTVKMMTAIVAYENMDLSRVITVRDISVVGQKMGLYVGENITVESLLKGLLVYSANDAAEVLAANYPGGREVFVSAMNRKAEDIGLSRTYYTNPSGLDGLTQVTTARDLERLGEYLISKPYLADIVNTKYISIANEDGVTRSFSNTNELLGVVEGVKGIKTGWTENARENLVVYVERDSKKVVFALLGSQDRFGEMRQLIEWVFTSYQWN